MIPGARGADGILPRFLWDREGATAADRRAAYQAAPQGMILAKQELFSMA